MINRKMNFSKENVLKAYSIVCGRKAQYGFNSFVCTQDDTHWYIDKWVSYSYLKDHYSPNIMVLNIARWYNGKLEQERLTPRKFLQRFINGDFQRIVMVFEPDRNLLSMNNNDNEEDEK